MSQKPPRRCIFCGENPATSKEHFWPTWMTKAIEFPASKSYTVATTHEHPPTGLFRSTKRTPNGSLNTMKLRVVCDSCNNGWMNRLEGEVRPTLEPLLRGTRSVLTPKNQNTLARWIVMKCIASEHSNNTAMTPFEIRKSVMDGDLPAAFRVYIGAHLSRPLGYARTSHTVARHRGQPLSKASLQEGLTKNIQQVTFTAGALLVHINASVADVMFEDLIVESAFYRAARIAPVRASNMHWPPTRALNEHEVRYISISLQRITESPAVAWTNRGALE
jgi:hypothetical protein